MRTSDEIYHRIRWDARFDPARFVLGIRQRGAEPKRMPLPAFVPGGDIPWHRVLFVEADGEVVWDRATGVDRLDATAAGRVRATRLLRAPFFTARTPFAWDSGAGRWRAAQAGAAPPAPGAYAGAPGAYAELRVLTWNTLWDRYDSERIDTARRRPLLLAALAAADADVIALQEVEPALSRLLAEAPWVRDRYTLDVDPTGRDVAGTGLLLLSRLPVREAAWHAFGPHKGVSAVTVETTGGPLVVATTHLSSDHSADGPARRRGELARLADGFGGVAADLVLVGDFNDAREGPDGPDAVLGLCDAWRAAHGAHDATPTFDPGGNPLAAVSSLTGRSGRIDRVLLRGAVSARRAALCGDEPAPDGLFASDHYGVVADLAVGAGNPPPVGTAALDAAPTARTAVVWLPPPDAWPVVEELRRAHDPGVDRWPPHVTVLFGFVPEHAFGRAVPLLAEAVAGVRPFTVRPAGVRTFRHRNGDTVWLDLPPDPGAERGTGGAGRAGTWSELRRALVERFPGCAADAREFTPHLTLGRDTGSGGRPGVAADCARRVGDELPSARVGELVVLSRRGDEPMRPRAVVPLGGPATAVRWLPEPAPTPQPGPEAGPEAGPGPGAGPGAGAGAGPGASAGADAAVARRIVERVASALAEGRVHLVGSRRMGGAAPGADVDLVAAVPGRADRADVRARIVRALPEATHVREVVGARVPGLRWEMAVPAPAGRARSGALGVDLILVGTGELPADLAVADRDRLPADAAVALSAVSDAEAVRAAARAAGNVPAFEALTAGVKAWARARGLDSAPFGGLPGLAWAVLAARTVAEHPESAADDPDLLGRFFGTWAAWDWSEPVALPGAARRPDHPEPTGPVTILTPTSPVRSCTTQVGAGFADLLADELYRAWESIESAAGADPRAALLAPPPLHRRHAAWLVLSVTAAGGARDLAENLGRARGRVRALLGALAEAGAADAHAWPRPFHRDAGAARYAIGLGASPATADLVRVAERWARPLPGVRCELVDGGAVPTLT